MKQNNTRRIRADGRPYNLFFIKPGKKNPREFAENVLKLDEVEEVMVTSGQFGYIVKSRSGVSESDSVHRYMERNHAHSFSKMKCYYKYRK